MKLPMIFNEYDIQAFIKGNWNEILELIEPSLEEWGMYGRLFFDELEKYEIDYLSISRKKENKDSENEEEQ